MESPACFARAMTRMLSRESPPSSKKSSSTKISSEPRTDAQIPARTFSASVVGTPAEAAAEASAAAKSGAEAKSGDAAKSGAAAKSGDEG